MNKGGGPVGGVVWSRCWQGLLSSTVLRNLLGRPVSSLAADAADAERGVRNLLLDLLLVGDRLVWLLTQDKETAE